MAGLAKSRWADEDADIEADLRKKRQKEERKRLKAEKAKRSEKTDAQSTPTHDETTSNSYAESGEVLSEPRLAKRRKLSPGIRSGVESSVVPSNSVPPVPSWSPCRNVDNFERLNHIEEGTYGWVSRARETGTGEIVALKKLKMDGNEHGGFPVTGLREIQCLKDSRHRHIVDLREIVVGDQLDEIFLVMEFLEHDLRTLQEDMQEPFMPSEIKTLMIQLTSAVEYLHDNWILHRDLKTSNILMSNRGEIKIADFGMARYFSSPAPPMTQLVVTLWYRAPELLLGAEKYDQAIDMWSVGCVFGELLMKEPLLQAKNEVGQLSKIFGLCGTPTEENWPGFRRFPNARALRLPRSQPNTGGVIRAKFPFLTSAGTSLLSSLLALNPSDRPSANAVLSHPYFQENPRPKSTAMFPTFPSKAGQEKKRRLVSPSAPKGGAAPKIGADAADFSGIFASRDNEEAGAGFQLKMI